jgi:ATP-dependent RNA circularization protein (DNA/RNA ligase family)
MGAISAFLISFLGPIVLSFCRNKAVKYLASEKNKSVSEVAKEIGEQSVNCAGRTIENAEKDGTHLSEDDKTATAEYVTHSIVSRHVENISTDDKAENAEVASDSQSAAEAAVARLDPEERDKIKKTANDEIDKQFKPEEHPG